MHILVIGGAGYIGSHVVRALLDENHTVTVYDNLSSGTTTNLFKEADFIQGDILDYAFLKKALEKNVDALVHLAAFKAAGESMLKPAKYSTNNISGTINILNAAVETDVRNIVFSSSAAVYGEPVYLPIDEDHPTEPENYYGFTKLEIERFLSWYDKLKGTRYAALRYFNAAGYDPHERILGLERNPANLLPVIMEVAAGKREKLQIFGNDYPTDDGTGIRDYIHVTDLASAHVQALYYITKNDTSLTVNLGSETGISVKAMLTAARRICERPIPAEITARRHGDPAKLIATSRKAREVLHWTARYSSLESLIATSWAVYRKTM